MSASPNHHEKSRLGRLLVSRGYLSEAQLSQGLALQRDTGQRLGEVLVQCGWISEHELHRVLRHQSRYRHAVALVAMVSLPFQPLVSLASTQTSSQPRDGGTGQDYLSATGLKPLSDRELGSLAGQGGEQFLLNVSELGGLVTDAEAGQLDFQGETDALDGLEVAATTFIPVLVFLDSDVTISGVHYASGQPRFELLPDGGLKLALPERIEAIRMDDIRVGEGAASLGSVSLHDVQFHPQSSMTIRLQ